MALLSELVVRITASTDGLTKGLANAQRSLGAVERQASTLTNTLGGLLTFAAVGSVISRATQAADAQEAAQRRLSATSKLLGLDLAGLQGQAEATAGRFQLSARVAQDFTGSMARLTAAAGQNNRVGEATAAWLNLAAANGISAEQSMDALRLTIVGQDEGLNKLGLANPSAIYVQWARAAGIAAGKMTDAQKAQAILDAVITAGGRTRDAYAEWLRSAAGQESVLRGKVEDTSAAFGRSFNGIRVSMVPALAAVARGMTAFAGGIQILGAELFVNQVRGRLWGLQIRDAVQSTVQAVAGHFTALASFLDRLPAPLRAMMGLGNVNLSSGLSNIMGANLAGPIAQAQAALRAAREARDEVAQTIIRDVSGFASAVPGGDQASPFTPPAGATGAVKHLSDAVDALGQKWADAAKRAGEAWKRVIDQTAVQAAVDRFRGALPSLSKPVPNIDSKVEQSIANAKGSGGIREAVNDFGQGVSRMLSQFTPVGIAFEAIARILDPLRPLLDALLVPFQIMGEILAASIVPVLRLLFPIIKAVAIVFSYVQEVVDRVLAAILNAVGSFVKGLGKFINAIVPFANPGNPLIKAGQAIIDTAHGFSDAAKEIAKKRKELEDLSFDDALNGAADAANKLSEALINAAQGFKVERFRFGATSTGAAASSAIRAATSSPSANVQAGSTTTINGLSIPVTLLASGNPEEDYRGLYGVLQRGALSHPEFRPVFALFPAPS